MTNEAGDAAYVAIEGYPILGGKVLRPSDPHFANLHGIQDGCRLAEQLRGQYSILIRSGATTTAITDTLGTYPIYLRRGTGTPKATLATRLAHLTAASSKIVSKTAVFNFIHCGGIGHETFYSDIGLVPAATVIRIHGDKEESKIYFRWEDHLAERPMGLSEAKRRFLEIALDYLGAIACRLNGRLACSLSGGTDSGVTAGLLKQILGGAGSCLTVDFSIKRYSEFKVAQQTAQHFGLPQTRLLVSGRAFRQAFGQLNGQAQDRPCADSQAVLSYLTAAKARANNIHCLVTGCYSTGLFLGDDAYFKKFPASTAEYLHALAQMSDEAKVRHLVPEPTLSTANEKLLGALGLPVEEYREWLQARYVRNRGHVERLLGSHPLPQIKQMRGIVWAGIPWQHAFWPAEASAHAVRFVSPFYDPEMIKFIVSLPTEFKFRDGLTRFIVRDVFRDWVGKIIPSRASPNPARLWSLWPGFAARRQLTTVLRAHYNQLRLKNTFRGGAHYGQILKVAALGMWLKAHGLSLPGCR